MHKQLPSRLLPFIWLFLKPYTPVVIGFILITICAGFWGPFNSIAVKWIINLLPQVSTDGLAVLYTPAILLVLNFIVFDNVTWRLIGYINYKYQARIKSNIIHALLEHVLNETDQFFQDNFAGQIASQINILADSVERILHRISCDIIRALSLLITAFVASFRVNPTFFYIEIIWFSCFATLSIHMSKQFVQLADEHAKTESAVAGQLVDVITNNSAVRIFSRTSFELDRMEQFLEKSKTAFAQKEQFALLLRSIQGSLIAVMIGVSLFFLIIFYKTQQVSIGDFALILGLCVELGHMMWFTMYRVDDLNESYGKCKQSLNALLHYPEITDAQNAKVLTCSQGVITFEHVKFNYKGSALIFQDKSVTINSGQKVGLVGYSGSGKSTFVKLILRLYDITEGAILIDGQDIRTVTQDSLHDAIGMIPQEPSLFHRNLLDNIGYGKQGASRQEIIAAAQKAHADEFIAQLPKGYESLVGERGIKLSGGQRQRIAIARAILKNAPILILDEATSQLDSVTEQLIQKSLWELMQGKTTIVIAHRLSTLLHMDRILVFDQGRIVQDGTHKQLLAQGGIYTTLWNAQVGGFLVE